MEPETEEEREADRINNVDLPQWSYRRKRAVIKVVDLNAPTTKTKPIGKKKLRIWIKSSSGEKETIGTKPGRVETKIRLGNGERSNIGLLRDQPPRTVPEELRKLHEQNSKLPKPEIETVNREWPLKIKLSAMWPLFPI